MTCRAGVLICTLREMAEAIRSQSPWDSFWPTLFATLLGALIAAGFSYLLFQAEQRRRDRAELLSAIGAVVDGLTLLGGAITDQSNAAVDIALKAYGAAVTRLRLATNSEREIVIKFIQREVLWWTSIPIDEMSNRSQIAREELIRWAKGTLAVDYFQQRFDVVGNSGREHPEAPETIPERLRDVNRKPKA